MRRFARLPSRVLAVAGAMVLGAIGTVALASPASAHTSELRYEPKCGPEAGTAIVAWTVKNNYRSAAEVKVNRALDGLKTGDKVEAGKSVVGTEIVKITDRQQALKVSLKWGDGFREDHEKTADLRKLDCSPKPTAEFADKCDGTTVVKVTNPEGGKATRVGVNGDGDWSERKELEPGEVWEVTVPAKHAKHVKVRLPGTDDVEHSWKSPEECYSVTHKSTCDKLTITVANEGTETLKASVKVGDNEETTEIPAGKSDTATFEGAEGLVVTLTVGKKSQEIKYTKPADCTPVLPVTGVNAGLLAGAALVLVSGGAGLFLVARRRRIRFAA